MPKKPVLAECSFEWIKEITCSEDNSNLRNYVKKNSPPKKKTVNKLTPEEKHWIKADEQAKWKIYNVLTHNIPLQNVKPVLENWCYEDHQTNLVGLFLEKDVDFRTIEADLENQYGYEDELPNTDYLAQEIAYHYLRVVVKGIISHLSNYDCHDPAWFEDLTN